MKKQNKSIKYSDSDSVSESGGYKKNKIVEIAKDAELFTDNSDGTNAAYATVIVDDHFETYAIDSPQFKNWLNHEYYKRYEGDVLSDTPMRDAIATLRAMASFNGIKHKIFLRIGESNGKYYYDLGNDKWQVVEIDADGWRVLDESPVKFVRPAGYLAQVTPIKGGNLDELRRFIRVGKPKDNRPDSQWILFIGTLLSHFRPKGPYPLLNFIGAQDAAKSTATRMYHSLIDPNSTKVRSFPREERDLNVGARNNWILAFDNLSKLSEEMSDALCRMSTGGGQSNRSLYSNADEFAFDVMRPVVLNGIEDIVTRPDLLDRTFKIYLEGVSDSERKAEDELYTEFDKAKPRILGAVFDAVSRALKNVSNVSLDSSPRMIDATIFVTAAESALEWKEATFLEAYKAYSRQELVAALDTSHFGTAILSLLESGENMWNAGKWEGTATDLLKALQPHIPNNVGKAFPSTARGVANNLRRMIKSLDAAGISVVMPETSAGVSRREDRLITITYRLGNMTASTEDDDNIFRPNFSNPTWRCCINPNERSF